MKKCGECTGRGFDGKGDGMWEMFSGAYILGTVMM